jgi:hypothetical protein
MPMQELRGRQIQTATYQSQAGNLPRAQALLEYAVAEMQPGGERADALWRLGSVRWQREGAIAGSETFRQALREGRDARLVAAIERDLALSLINAGDVSEAGPHASCSFSDGKGPTPW